MCGRYAQAQGMDEIIEAFELDGSLLESALPLNWNIAPTNEIYIIRDEHQSRVLDSASWGIIAPWEKSLTKARASQSHAINARSESVFEKPTFRSAFRTSRCLIPASGYYEWASALGEFPPKQPFYITSENPDGLLPMAGIYSRWKSETGQEIQCAAIITREAVGKLATIHSRMPVMMPQERWEHWLDPKEREIDHLISVMKIPEPDRGLRAYPISTQVNVVANNGPEIIKEIELGQPQTLF
jgi:putative SOS response-associated peptidase YedK